MDHTQDYPPEYLASILSEVKTIGMVGASPDPTSSATACCASRATT